jgi:hypothetical protein
VEEPGFRISRFLAAFSDIDKDLKRYNFYVALNWLEINQPDLAAEVNTQIDLLSKDLMGHQIAWDSRLDSAELNPNAQHLSEVSKLLRRVANDIQRGPA